MPLEAAVAGDRETSRTPAFPGPLQVLRARRGVAMNPPRRCRHYPRHRHHRRRHRTQLRRHLTNGFETTPFRQITAIIPLLMLEALSWRGRSRPSLGAHGAVPPPAAASPRTRPRRLGAPPRGDRSRSGVLLLVGRGAAVGSKEGNGPRAEDGARENFPCRQWTRGECLAAVALAQTRSVGGARLSSDLAPSQRVADAHLLAIIVT